MQESQRRRPSRVDRWGVRGQGRPFEAVEDVAEVQVPAVGELGDVVRGLARRVGAEMAVFVIADGEPDERVEVLAAWGVVPDPHALRLAQAHGFLGGVLSRRDAVLEVLGPDRDDSLGIAASGARLTHAAGASARPPGGPVAALCVGFSVRPSNPALVLWIVESYARLASLCLPGRAAPTDSSDRGIAGTLGRGVAEGVRVVADVPVVSF